MVQVPRNCKQNYIKWPKPSKISKSCHFLVILPLTSCLILGILKSHIWDLILFELWWDFGSQMICKTQNLNLKWSVGPRNLFDSLRKNCQIILVNYFFYQTLRPHNALMILENRTESHSQPETMHQLETKYN